MATSDCSTCNGLSNVVKMGLFCTGNKEIESCIPGEGGLCGTQEICLEGDCIGPYGNPCSKRSEKKCKQVLNTCTCANKTYYPMLETHTCNQTCPPEYNLIPGTTLCKLNK